MDVHLAHFPVPRGLSGSAALSFAEVLIKGEPQQLSHYALAMSLMHGSWAEGRMTLAAHLKYLATKLENPGWHRNFVRDLTLSEAAELLPDPTEALQALESLELWAAHLRADKADALTAFQVAEAALEQAVSMASEEPQAHVILNSLLAHPVLSNLSRNTKKLEADLFSGFRAPSPHIVLDNLCANQPYAIAGRLAMLQALAGSGFSGMGTVTGRTNSSAQNRSNTPKSAPPGDTAGDDAADDKVHHVKVFDRTDVIEAIERAPSGGPFDDNKKQSHLMQTMANDSGLRPLGQVASLEVLDELYARFPHFTPVIDFVKRSLALAACGEAGRPAKVPPILLKAEPGAGKTYFAQELARVLGVVFLERDLSVTSEAFVINGMDSGWKNAKPGIVFDALVKGKQANPLILLNEVDKAMTTGTHNSPLAPMHALLEPTSAARFVDEYLPVAIDARHVIWVLTANDGAIPAPILSRLEVFEIPAPNAQECKLIAQSVWTSICEHTFPRGHGFPTELTPTLLEHLSQVSPRVMRKALTYAASNAALSGRKFIQLEDLEESGKRYAPAVRNPLGFVQ